ncbi:unnamed protein product, partial [Meganyctiphanes norvegica]
MEVIPKDLRGLRACLVCSLVKTLDMFESEGCDNCDEFLNMKNNRDNVYDCTSQNHDGFSCVIVPRGGRLGKVSPRSRDSSTLYLPNLVLGLTSGETADLTKKRVK